MNDIDGWQKPNVKPKKPDTEYILCDSIYIKYKNRQINYAVRSQTVVTLQGDTGMVRGHEGS